MNAIEQLKRYLEDDEKVEYIIFGGWGGTSFWQDDGTDDGETRHVPLDKRNIKLTLEEAEPYMQAWGFNGGYGSTDCYATYIWTNKSIIFVSEYDGSTSLSCVPIVATDGIEPQLQ